MKKPSTEPPGTVPVSAAASATRLAKSDCPRRRELMRCDSHALRREDSALNRTPAPRRSRPRRTTRAGEGSADRRLRAPVPCSVGPARRSRVAGARPSFSPPLGLDVACASTHATFTTAPAGGAPPDTAQRHHDLLRRCLELQRRLFRPRQRITNRRLGGIPVGAHELVRAVDDHLPVCRGSWRRGVSRTRLAAR